MEPHPPETADGETSRSAERQAQRRMGRRPREASRRRPVVAAARSMVIFAALLTPLPASAYVVELPPATGVPVPALDAVDVLVKAHMEANGISGGVVGIMRDGVVVYQRGFGWKDEARTILMPENALVRLASCTKPFTASAIRKLEASGVLSLDDFAFDLGQPEGGILTIPPYSGWHDPLYEDVTVRHCLEHRAGWASGATAKLPFSDCDLASLLGISSPVDKKLKISWLLSQNLAYAPGGGPVYAGEGYLVLGQIVEQVSGIDLVSFHRSHVLTPDMWVPATDLILGAGLYQPEPNREAWYDDSKIKPSNYPGGGMEPCDPANLVPIAYGGWNHESKVGSGGLVVSAAVALELAERYQVQLQSSTIGIPLTTRVDGLHGGTLNGTNTLIVQRSDGLNVFLFFNKNDKSKPHYARWFYDNQLETLLNSLSASGALPSLAVDGFWVDPDKVTGGFYGSYDMPFADLDEALGYVVDGSRLNFQSGTSNWTGTLTTQLELRAPLGAVTLGKLP